MLSREVMGALALAILWVNTLLIAAAASKAAAALARLGRAFGKVTRATVLRGDGPAGALASLEIEQVGRLGADPVIAFHDRSHTCRIFGGRVSVEGGAEIEVLPSDIAEVWIDPLAITQAASCPSEAAFDAASPDARKARGFTRTVITPVIKGAQVFVATGLVSTLDPRSWIAKRIALAYAFVLTEVLIAAACTAASLQAPHFGPVSTAGAAAALVFFLLVQPAGTVVRDALLPPSRSPRHDTWTRAVALPSQAAHRRPESST